MKHATTLLLLAAALAVPGCAKRQLDKMDKAEEQMWSDLTKTDYDKDMVKANEGLDEYDRGSQASVSPKTLASIQDTVTNVYERDFGRCLQRDMEAYENRWIAGTFSMEVTINTAGKVTNVNIPMIDIKERRPPKGVPKDKFQPREAKLFASCVEESAFKWEFDPPPEVEYVYTYTGKVGEAY
ncbi:MAG TPA: hypothetical protein VIK91_14100 [Nannocystis sp.]